MTNSFTAAVSAINQQTRYVVALAETLSEMSVNLTGQATVTLSEIQADGSATLLIGFQPLLEITSRKDSIAISLAPREVYNPEIAAMEAVVDAAAQAITYNLAEQSVIYAAFKNIETLTGNFWSQMCPPPNTGGGGTGGGVTEHCPGAPSNGICYDLGRAFKQDATIDFLPSSNIADAQGWKNYTLKISLENDERPGLTFFIPLPADAAPHYSGNDGTLKLLVEGLAIMSPDLYGIDDGDSAPAPLPASLPKLLQSKFYDAAANLQRLPGLAGIPDAIHSLYDVTIKTINSETWEEVDRNANLINEFQFLTFELKQTCQASTSAACLKHKEFLKNSHFFSSKDNRWSVDVPLLLSEDVQQSFTKIEDMVYANTIVTTLRVAFHYSFLCQEPEPEPEVPPQSSILLGMAAPHAASIGYGLSMAGALLTLTSVCDISQSLKYLDEDEQDETRYYYELAFRSDASSKNKLIIFPTADLYTDSPFPWYPEDDPTLQMIDAPLQTMHALNELLDTARYGQQPEYPNNLIYSAFLKTSNLLAGSKLADLQKIAMASTLSGTAYYMQALLVEQQAGADVTPKTVTAPLGLSYPVISHNGIISPPAVELPLYSQDIRAHQSENWSWPAGAGITKHSPLAHFALYALSMCQEFSQANINSSSFAGKMTWTIGGNSPNQFVIQDWAAGNMDFAFDFGENDMHPCIPVSIKAKDSTGVEYSLAQNTDADVIFQAQLTKIFTIIKHLDLYATLKRWSSCKTLTDKTPTQNPDCLHIPATGKLVDNMDLIWKQIPKANDNSINDWHYFDYIAHDAHDAREPFSPTYTEPETEPLHS